MTQVYAQFLTSNSMFASYTTPPSNPTRVTYPVESDSLGILGPLFVPSIYARDLDNIEIGSSGGIALSLFDKYTLSITKNSGNATTFQSVDNYPISIQSGDTAKTVSVGDLTVSGTNISQGNVRRVNLGGSTAYRLGTFYDIVQQSANVVALSSGTAATNLMGTGVGFVDSATSFKIANVYTSGTGAVVNLYTNLNANATIASYVATTTNLSSLAFLANNLFVQNANGQTMFGVTSTGNTVNLTAGSATNPMTMKLQSSDPSNTITIGNIITSKYTDPLTGRQSAVIDTAGLLNTSGLIIKENVTIPSPNVLYVGNICGVSNNVTFNSGLIVNGPLTVQDSTGSSITWNNVDIHDKVITLSAGSTGPIASSVSGIDIDCGTNVALTPSVLWNANGQSNTTMNRPSADSECYWRVSGGHMRISSPLIEYGFRVNSKYEMELFKVKYDASGNQLGSAVVVTRWGGALPPAKY